jgi:LacI family transcriptional regulator
MSGILKLPELPTAIVCVTDALAIGAMRAIAHAGLKPGHDISVIGYDGAPFGLLVDPPLTTIMQPNHLSGQEAARIIRTLVESPEPQIIQKLWDATLVPRASTSPPPKRRKRAR